ncbi:hypothetical protein NKDENANG_04076 [Candidatus Entotheonellaceae bacterium PAL068K]
MLCYGLASTGFYSIDELLERLRTADGTAVERAWLAEHLGYRDAFVPAVATGGTWGSRNSTS